MARAHRTGATVKRTPAESASRRVRLLVTGFAALAFGLGGVLVIALAIVSALRSADEVSAWQPVSVRVREVKLQTYDDSDAVSLHARYAYRVNDREYEGRTIGLIDSADDVGGWHHFWFDRLDDARRNDRPVAGWYDPAHPGQAVLDRQVRWNLLAYRSLFALLVVAVGVAAGWGFFRALRGEPERIVQLLEDD